MPTKNIFAGNGIRSEFVNLVYQMLMKRDFVSYADVLSSYYKRPDDYFNKHSLSSEPGCGELKKAFPNVLRALEEKCPKCIKNNGKKTRECTDFGDRRTRSEFQLWHWSVVEWT